MSKKVNTYLPFLLQCTLVTAVELLDLMRFLKPKCRSENVTSAIARALLHVKTEPLGSQIDGLAIIYFLLAAFC